MKRLLSALLAAAGVIFVWHGSVAPAGADSDQSKDCAQQMVWAANEHGFRVRDLDTEFLATGDARNYSVSFTRDAPYVVFACGDSATVDLDLYLYDGKGDLIGQDPQQDNRPVLEISPKWTGPFVIQVKMYDSWGPSFYTMAVMYQ